MDARVKIKNTVGISDFKKLIDTGGYFVDKSLFIKQVWNDSEIVLIPRPRRFGKTLNMSMLRYFFEKSEEERSYLFKNLKIWEEEEIRKLHGKFPVVFITLKDAKYSNFDSFYGRVIHILSEIYQNFLYLEPVLSRAEQKTFENIIYKRANQSEYESSLGKLTEYLLRYHKEHPIVLMDEYDVPIQAGYVYGYYDDAIEFMRNFLSATFKDNPFIRKGVLTGNLRISKESIFTGMNNLSVYTLLSHSYSDSFGFTEDELIKILKDTGLEGELDGIRYWYNGYTSGKKTVYNPWSILNYVSKPEDGFKPYWVSTSSNDLIRKLILEQGIGLKGEMEKLLNDEEIEKVIDENINFKDLDSNEKTVFSLMLFSGYLKQVKCRQEEERIVCNLKIPNKEVKYIYKTFFYDWLTRSFSSESEVRYFMDVLLSGREEEVESMLQDFVINSLSFHDITGNEVPEKVYKAFILGLFVMFQKDFIIESEPESGYGRADVLIIPRDKNKNGVVIEFKKVNKKRKETVEQAFTKAKTQIEERKYEQKIKKYGIKTVLKYGVVFDGKEV